LLLAKKLGIEHTVNISKVNLKEIVNSLAYNTGADVAGTFADDIKTAKLWVSLGVQYMAFSVDVGILYETSKNIVDHLVN